MISFGIKDALSPYNYMLFLDKEGVELVEKIALKQEQLDSSKTAYQCYKYFVDTVYTYGRPAGSGIGTEKFLIETLESVRNKKQRLKSRSHKDFALEVLNKQEFEASVKLLTKGNVCVDNLLAYLRYLEGQLHTTVPF